MHRLLITLSALCLTACFNGGGAETAGSTPVPLFHADPGRSELGRLDYRGGIEVTHPDRRFGGWSALEISEDGTRLLAVSDHAYWMAASVGWTRDGLLSGLTDIENTPMLGVDGQALTGRQADPEAIANLGGGRYAVSFERHHRINAYELGEDLSEINSAHGQALSVPPGAADLPANSGMEGLTPLGSGELLVGVQGPPRRDEPRLLWRSDGTDWHAVRLRATPEFALTSLARHDGHIYALERYWGASDGTWVRIIRFPEAALTGDTIIEPELLGALDEANSVDNFEGIAVLERNGETLIVIISDDNYSNRQRTLMLAFALR